MVPFEVKLTGLTEVFNNLEVRLVEVQKEFDILTESLTKKHSNSKEILEFDHIAQVISSTVLNQISSLLAGVHSRKHDLQLFFSDIGGFGKGQKRLQRSLFNGGGIFMQYAFGVALESDVEQNQFRLDELSDVYDSISQNLNIHSEILNSSLAQILKLSERQDQMQGMLSQIQTQLREFNYASRISLQGITQISLLTNNLSSLNLGLLELYMACQDLKNGLEIMAEGRLSASIFPPHQVLAIINHLVSEGQPVMFAAHNKFLQIYYEIISVFPTKNMFEYFLSVPVGTQAHNYFNLYEVKTHPLLVKDNFIIHFEHLPAFFAINSDKSLMMELPSLNHCKKVRDLYLCENEFPVLNLVKTHVYHSYFSRILVLKFAQHY